MMVPIAAMATLSAQVPADAPAEQVYKPGGDVKPPKVIHRSDPEYSEEARKNGVNGHVDLCAVVGTDGLPRAIKITRSVGSGLDEQAVLSLRRWRFKPGTKNGEPVPVEIKVEVWFNYSAGAQAFEFPIHKPFP